MTITHRVEALAHGVLGPLVLGGRVHLVPPIGAKTALSVEPGTRIVDDDLRTKVDVARVRVARTLLPVDTLPDLPLAEWSMVAALNDLLQATNHHLSGAFTRGRHEALIASVEGLVGAIAAPRSVLEAVSRHATFARLADLVRTDTVVRWWTGSAKFRGEAPPKRLFSWKELRRVRSEESTVAIGDLPDGVEAVSKERWLGALALFLTRSPVTDVATLTRGAPRFAWSKETLSLVASPLGRKLAARGLAHGIEGASEAKEVVAALEASVNRMPAGAGRELALAFATEAAGKVRP